MEYKSQNWGRIHRLNPSFVIKRECGRKVWGGGGGGGEGGEEGGELEVGSGGKNGSERWMLLWSEMEPAGLE